MEKDELISCLEQFRDKLRLQIDAIETTIALFKSELVVTAQSNNQDEEQDDDVSEEEEKALREEIFRYVKAHGATIYFADIRKKFNIPVYELESIYRKLKITPLRKPLRKADYATAVKAVSLPDMEVADEIEQFVIDNHKKMFFSEIQDILGISSVNLNAVFKKLNLHTLSISDLENNSIEDQLLVK